MVLMPRDLRGSLSSFMHYKKEVKEKEKKLRFWNSGQFMKCAKLLSSFKIIQLVILHTLSATK